MRVRFQGFLLIFFLQLLAVNSSESALPASFLKTSRCDLRDHAGTGEIVYLRGVNLGGWLFFEGWMCPGVIDTVPNNPHQEEVEDILIQRFGIATKDALVDIYQSTWITSPDLDLVALAGMNLVRVPFTYSVFQEQKRDPSMPLDQVPWKSDADAFKHLDWLVNECAQRGIYVLFDFHHPEGDSTRTGLYAYTAYQDRFVEIWRRMAAHFAGNPTVLGYDLVNESEEASNRDAVWNRAYQAIRAVDPDHIIVPEYYSITKTAQVMDTYHWQNVMASTHDYNTDGTNTYKALMAARAALPGTTVCPYFVGEFADSSDSTPRLRYYSDCGAPWTSWTLKSVNQMDWSMINELANGASSSADVPNLSTNSAAEIAAKWAKWRTRNPAARFQATCNRLSSPLPRDDLIPLVTNGPVFFTAQTLLANDFDLSTLCQLLVTNLPARTAHGAITALTNGYFYQPDPGFVGSDTFSYYAVDQRLHLTSAYPATVTFHVPVPGTFVPVTLIPVSEVWRYFDKTNDLGTAWRSNNFDDGSWSSGRTMLGFGDANGLLPTTLVASNRQWTTYFRRAFYVPNADMVSSLSARLMRDDGAVVYLNGTEVWRDTNMPPGIIANTTPALRSLGGAEESTWLTNALDASALITGTNILAIEVHQNALNSSDLTMNFELSATAVIPDDTRLSLIVTGASVLLTWPFDAAHLGLYTSTNLTPPIIWIPVTNTPALLNNRWQITFPNKTNRAHFYRLQTP